MSGGVVRGDAVREEPYEPRTGTVRRVVWSATAGTFVEYYDFAVYGALAAVLAGVFFPAEDPVVGLLSTFAVFAIAFVARPLGGFIWGPIGDRIGRRRTLSAIVIVMSVATVGIGLIPGYATIGVLAPTLLVVARLVQGLSAGGEVAGAAIFVGEHSPSVRRGYFVSWLNVATTSALLAGILVAAGLQAVLDDAQTASWGWRIPFLLAGPVGLIGLYIRLKVDETPSFQSVKARNDTARVPLVAALRHTTNYRQMGVAAAYYMPTLVSFYLLLTYMPTFMVKQLGFDAAASLVAITAAAVVQILLIPIFGSMSDRFGRRIILRWTSFAFLVLALPSFLLLGRGFWMAILGLVLLAIPTAAALANNLAPALERFPTNIRYTASAAALGLAVAVFGGTAPYVSTWLVEETGRSYAPALYLVVTILPSLAASFFVRETAGERLPE